MKRLRDKKAIQKIYHNGKRRSSGDLTLLYLENKSLQCNYAVHVAKRFGIAVKRNRIKRVFRELLLRFRERLIGYDIVIRPKRKAGELNFNKLFQRLERMFIEAEIPNQK
ncbi:MAG TPA: ribonuclease P protein component [Nitrospiria bacterium]|nr:ribonuclease P protein component [Candidatus Manganitrophaceae bacterium]HIL35712.1 ribonuclease P protein component [Candidatus Manganitrophaceae bacterium]